MKSVLLTSGFVIFAGVFTSAIPLSIAPENQKSKETLRIPFLMSSTYDSFQINVTLDGKPFTFEVDTGSSDFIVNSNLCTVTYCKDHPQVQVSNNSLFTGPYGSTQTTYEDHSGYYYDIYSTTVKVGSAAVEEMFIGASTLIKNVSLTNPLGPGQTGIIGFGYPDNSDIVDYVEPNQASKALPLINTMRLNNIIDTNAFTLCYPEFTWDQFKDLYTTADNANEAKAMLLADPRFRGSLWPGSGGYDSEKMITTPIDISQWEKTEVREYTVTPISLEIIPGECFKVESGTNDPIDMTDGLQKCTESNITVLSYPKANVNTTYILDSGTTILDLPKEIYSTIITAIAKDIQESNITDQTFEELVDKVLEATGSVGFEALEEFGLSLNNFEKLVLPFSPTLKINFKG
eukprot:Awhi_evm1s13122